VVIYDNACGLHRYCMAREPAFFKNTRFYSDRFHLVNHKDCARTFCIDVAGLRISTSLVESENKAVKSVKGHCQHMRKDTFMWFFRLFFVFRNLLLRRVPMVGLV
jgi:hypothetical protein